LLKTRNYGIDANLADNRGRTPLHHACERSHLAVIKFLLSFDEKRVNAEIKNIDGRLAGDVSVCAEGIHGFVEAEKLRRKTKPIMETFRNDETWFKPFIIPPFTPLPRPVPKVRLGIGGNNQVLLCEVKDERGQWKEAAVRVSKHAVSKGSPAAKELNRELLIWAAVQDHPNVVPLLAFYEGPSNFYIFTDIAKTGDLYKYLYEWPTDASGVQTEGRAYWMEPREFRQLALHLMLDVAKGIAHLHKVGIVHGDLKPGNVLIQVGRAKVMDFDSSVSPLLCC
jgi:hypothetical protein